MNRKHESTQLFDGLSFETSVQLYHEVLERVLRVEGPAPNLYSKNWPETADEFQKRKEEVFEREGYALEYFDVIGFRFSKGTGKYEYRVDFVPSEFSEVRNYRPMVIAQFDLRTCKTAAEVAEVGLQYCLGVELNSMLPKEGDYRIEVRNVHGQWDNFHSGYARSLGEAIRIKRDLEDGIVSSERGNAFCEARVTLYGQSQIALGYIWIPPFGDITFIPTQKNFRHGGRWTPGLSPETAEKLIWRHREEEDEIAKLWPYIVRHSKRIRWDDPTEFVFENQDYWVSRGTSAVCQPGSAGICQGRWRSNLPLKAAYRSGLLYAWAQAFGYQN